MMEVTRDLPVAIAQEIPAKVDSLTRILRVKLYELIPVSCRLCAGG